MRDPAAIKDELAWQLQVGANSTRQKKFKRDVMGNANLMGFAAMKSGLAYVQGIHSLVRCSGPGMPSEVKDLKPEFVGDQWPH